MTKETIYRYLGTNGVIESPVHLEDIYYVRLTKLTAGRGKILTDGSVKVRTVIVPENELDNWTEIDIGQE
jgi:hypothetical protein